MVERISTTAHGDAPLTAAQHPDATAAGLSASPDDELSGRTVTINRSVEDLVSFWRDRAAILKLLGDRADTWSSVIFDEQGDSAIHFHSAPNADRRVRGRVEFRPAPADRGTEVTLTLASEDRNFLSKAVDKLRGQDPTLDGRAVLRRFKQLMEAGEIARVAPPSTGARTQELHP